MFRIKTVFFLATLIVLCSCSAGDPVDQEIPASDNLVISMLNEQLEYYDDFPVRLQTLREGGNDPRRDSGKEEIAYGNACLYRAEWACAKRYFRQAVFLDHYSVPAWRGLMTALAADDDLSGLIIEAKRFNQFLPNHSLGWLFLVYAYDRLNLTEEADKAYARYHRVDIPEPVDETGQSGLFGEGSGDSPDQASYDNGTLPSSLVIGNDDLFPVISDPAMMEEFEQTTGYSSEEYLNTLLDGVSRYIEGDYEGAEEVFNQIGNDPGIQKYISEILLPLLMEGNNSDIISMTSIESPGDDSPDQFLIGY